MDDPTKGIYDLWMQGHSMDALEKAWHLPPLYPYRYLRRGEMDLSGLIVRSCQQAVERARHGEVAQIKQWVDRLLASPPSSALIDHEDGHAPPWCRSYRTEIICTYLRCTQIACWAEELAPSGQLAPRKRATGKTAQALLEVAWKAIAPADPLPDLADLGRQLLDTHWPSVKITPVTMANRAFELLRDHIGIPPRLPFALLREITAHLIAHGQRREPIAAIAAPFALVKDMQPGSKDAVLARLLFERLPDGRGDVFLAPERAFVPLDEDFFCRLFRDVPIAVGRLLDDRGVAFRHYDIRVRIEWLHPEGALIDTPLRGNSASGAAAWGLYFAWTGKVPDGGLIVVAQVDRNGDLSGVDDIETKVRAIVEDGHFGTIVVANDANARDANAALDTLAKMGHIKLNFIGVENLHASKP